ncbi:MAG: oligoribonuclease [Nitrospinaceae bacterium]|nr:oligoribonuclease [Nitrospinaceae bacterium]NIR54456.1 oligoribonuclease [Nitrospinaceae bacterium]NIS84875.1 oligoribonuclease [Nitrospinaceae bacterium]NIT81687.1 oligoribonuclease [Nitrospinaceae bacterium]NIU43958.1 oligoribonuclease [Nitrospinaceae bacterium]
MSQQDPNNLVWMDLEMTGLDPETEVIIEIATIITDAELNILEEGPVVVISQNDEILNQMDEWNQRTHGASGLTQKVRESTISIEEAEMATLEFIKKYVPYNIAPLCGNSVGQDRRFLYKYMPHVSNYLHYRNIDVTSIKEIVKRWYPKGPKFPKKSDEHKALVDIRESIAELVFYREHFFIEPVSMISETGSNTAEES